jgi:hypothetical protein
MERELGACDLRMNAETINRICIVGHLQLCNRLSFIAGTGCINPVLKGHAFSRAMKDA